jgi:hypothetical protein
LGFGFDIGLLALRGGTAAVARLLVPMAIESGISSIALGGLAYVATASLMLGGVSAGFFGQIMTYLGAYSAFKANGLKLSTHLLNRYFAYSTPPGRVSSTLYTIPSEFDTIVTQSSSYTNEVQALKNDLLNQKVPLSGKRPIAFSKPENGNTIDLDAYVAINRATLEYKHEDGRLLVRISDRYNFEWHPEYLTDGQQNIIQAGAHTVSLIETLGLTAPYNWNTNWYETN